MSAQSSSIANLSRLRMQNVETGSRNQYERSSAHFIVWLDHHKPQLVNEEFRAGSPSLPIPWDFVLRRLQNHEDAVDPIDFGHLSHLDFLEWVTGLKKASGEEPGFSSLNGHKSALKNLFRDYKKQLSPEFSSELAIYFSAIKRTKAKAAASGEVPAKVGKDPMNMSLFQCLMKMILKQKKKHFCWAHTMLTISWNLMCRSRNSLAICSSHMGWSEDALTILFAHQKNDQSGDRRDPRHVYANPTMPHICPILSLGIYLIVYPMREGHPALFSGDYDRFRKILKNFYQTEEVKVVLSKFGLSPDDLGTHSCRKGACTYCTSGTTGGPGTAPVHLRAGWVMPSVHGTYMKYEAAADQFVGRTVCGLPSSSPDFAILPPFFIRESENITQGIRQVFPTIPASMALIGRFCLASLVHHHQWLRDNLHPRHPVFQGTLFRSPTLLTSLTPLVVARLFRTGDPLSATGIPTHIGMMVQFQELQKELATLTAEVRESRNAIVADISRDLEERAIEARSVTPERLEQVLEQRLESLSERMQSWLTGISTPPAPALQTPPTPSAIAFEWGGMFHLLPQDYDFPQGPPHVAFSYWCLGNPQEGIPPLKRITASDLGSLNQRKRLCDLRFLMRAMEEIVQFNQATLPTNDSPASQQLFFETERQLLAQLTNDAPGVRTTRPHERHWQTYVKHLRKKNRTE